MYDKINKFKICVSVLLLIGLINSVSGSVAVSIVSDNSSYYLGEIVQFTITVNITNGATCVLTNANVTIKDGNSTVCSLPTSAGNYGNYGNCNLSIFVTETNYDNCHAGYGGNNLYTYKINWTIPSGWSTGGHTAEVNVSIASTTNTSQTAFDINIATLQYNLYKKSNSTGLNLVSFPLMPSPSMTTAEDVCNAIPGLEVITQWDPINQKYKAGYVCALKIGNFNLTPGIGYSVSVSGNVTNWILNRSVILPVPINLIKKPGSTGLNLIGLPYNSIISPFTAEGLCQSIPNSETVTPWDPINQKYKAGHVCGTPIGNFGLVKGVGYFVSVSANTTWTPI